jgi:hypothetical protein
MTWRPSLTHLNTHIDDMVKRCQNSCHEIRLCYQLCYCKSWGNKNIRRILKKWNLETSTRNQASGIPKFVLIFIYHYNDQVKVSLLRTYGVLGLFFIPEKEICYTDTSVLPADYEQSHFTARNLFTLYFFKYKSYRIMFQELVIGLLGYIADYSNAQILCTVGCYQK